MYKSHSTSCQASLFWDLETMLDPKHSLFKLADMIVWSCFEKNFAPLFCADNGRPPKPIRLMVGLLMLKHLRNVSDEQVVAQFTENAYYQYFCGMEAFGTAAPCAASELVHFRHRIGEEGVELILKESIRVNVAIEDMKKEDEDRKNRKDGRGRKNDEDQTAFIDSTVQEKNVTYPTDSKLLNKIIDYCHKVAKAEGTKVSIVRLWNGIIVGALSFRNEYDGHTIDRAMEQVDRIHGRKVKYLAGDRGYRGQQTSGNTEMLIPDVPKVSDSDYKKAKKHKLFRKRAGIEPIIGHCKSDHRLGRNFYKGLFGDSVNVMLAAAAFNLKRAMRALLALVQRWIFLLFGKREGFVEDSASLMYAHTQTF